MFWELQRFPLSHPCGHSSAGTSLGNCSFHLEGRTDPGFKHWLPIQLTELTPMRGSGSVGPSFCPPCPVVGYLLFSVSSMTPGGLAACEQRRSTTASPPACAPCCCSRASRWAVTGWRETSHLCQVRKPTEGLGFVFWPNLWAKH